ncbi:MAG: adenylate kinase [Buchnera aphidicola (Periphyllus lyropictus)]|uniref:adenylate kinase family protein n=1 Tax=Buchnera aphidicola TaxID=9 RepID=UPI001EB3664F|nr:nucleoside monophosphate kinase [Buchnera aphidicola]NIH16508.1 adenylate kinase [Buchnera aphidicola (Periphyllus lyropictus)]USS94793.1 nucleoside monophosphate kinase [Buchnera aphidicola (Periphyllus lyropictus)]
MRIILIGYPCSGKGTHSNFISKKYKIPKISTGDLLREIILKKNKKYIKIKKKMEKGELISDKNIIKLVKKRISKKDCNKGYILDGFPRTIKQVKMMYKEKLKINFIIELLISKKIILKRALGRKIHLNSGRIYHKIYNPPLINNKDDITGEKLITRKDDNIKVIKKRINEYKKFKKIFFKFYKNKKIRKNVKIIKINAKKKLKNIQIKIKKILKKEDFCALQDSNL